MGTLLLGKKMTTTTLQEQARALGDPTRHAIFRHIAEVARPIGIAELNEQFPLNHNAIRQHLAKLLSAGLIIESSVQGERGRPRLVYEINSAVGGQWGTEGPYERLSRLLVEIIGTGKDPADVGRDAAATFRVPSPSGDVVADIGAAMARQGFEPDVRLVRDGADIVLHNCPFATAAVADRETICSLHLGIAEGLADKTSAAVTELVAYDPRKAGCRLRIRVIPERSPGRAPPPGILSLRGRRASGNRA
jgi:predicted ArsR family transcriptional regulator